MLSTSDIVEKVDYKQYSNRKLLLIPISIFMLSVVILVGWYVMTGLPVLLGVEFTGGSELRVSPTEELNSATEISSAFSTQPSSIRQVPVDNTYILTFGSDSDIEQIEEQAESSSLEVRSSSSISATFGGQSQSLTVLGMVGAFGAMSLIVFGLFRTAIPSVAVVSSALSDLIVPLALMNLLGIELSLGIVAALLMLIGYSIDSDMLLNDYVVKRGGNYYESVYDAMETGLTMTLTSFVAMVIMTIGGFLLGVPLLQDIGFIIAFGLIVDVMNTYLLNVTLLRWYRFKGVSK